MTTTPCEDILPALPCKSSIRFEGMTSEACELELAHASSDSDFVQKLYELEALLRSQGRFETRANVNCFVYGGWVWPENLRQRISHRVHQPSEAFEQFVQDELDFM